MSETQPLYGTVKLTSDGTARGTHLTVDGRPVMLRSVSMARMDLDSPMVVLTCEIIGAECDISFEATPLRQVGQD